MPLPDPAIKQRLLSRRDELEQQEHDNQQAREVVTLDQTSVGRLSRMDAMQAQAMAQATHRRAQVELQRISSALKRLELGDYGDCLHCGEPIAELRLQFDPATTLCIDCAENADQ